MRMEMRDLVVVLPGVTGSILAKDGKDVWALSSSALTTYLRSFGASLDQLTLHSVDDATLDDLGDGITATQLMPDSQIIPGFWKIDGYGVLTKRLLNSFELNEGRNFLTFPYDWRRDNRVSARKLAALIATALPVWREMSGNQQAKVILITHSMGGIIARRFVEVLEGWRLCRALITFGTPYRGSVKALSYLYNGYKLGTVDLSPLFRSCASVYQLLPTYPCCSFNDNVCRVSELPPDINCDLNQVRSAQSFHD